MQRRSDAACRASSFLRHSLSRLDQVLHPDDLRDARGERRGGRARDGDSFDDGGDSVRRSTEQQHDRLLRELFRRELGSIQRDSCGVRAERRRRRGDLPLLQILHAAKPVTIHLAASVDDEFDPRRLPTDAHQQLYLLWQRDCRRIRLL